MKKKIFSFIKYTLFFLCGILLLGYLIAQIGDAEVKNSPFHENTLELIKVKKVQEPAFLLKSEELKNSFKTIDKSKKEKIEAEMLTYFTYEERLSLGLNKVGRDLAGANYFWVGLSLIMALMMKNITEILKNLKLKIQIFLVIQIYLL